MSANQCLYIANQLLEVFSRPSLPAALFDIAKECLVFAVPDLLLDIAKECLEFAVPDLLLDIAKECLEFAVLDLLSSWISQKTAWSL